MMNTQSHCSVDLTSSTWRLNRELIATRRDGRGDSWGARSAGSASRAQEWDFDFPPTLVAKYLELWIVQAKGYYLQRRLLLQGGYPSYEYAIVPPIRTAGPSCAVTTSTPLST